MDTNNDNTHTNNDEKRNDVAVENFTDSQRQPSPFSKIQGGVTTSLSATKNVVSPDAEEDEVQRLLTLIDADDAVTPFSRSEIKRIFSNDRYVAEAFAHEFFKPEHTLSLASTISAYVRPEGSFLATDNPCPKAFMQKDSLFIDGINVDVAGMKGNPEFWWQPVVNPHAYQLAQAVASYRDAANKGHGVNFIGITNVIPGS